jgi:catechol 2,3-dioxygenase-like lactoylglutathione lyase family enzyme
LLPVADAVLDHVAIGTGTLADGWQLFTGVLGGTWAYGGDSPGFWWGQLKFAAGPKVELLTPTGGPDAAFLERFLAARGAGPHHFNFSVPDIETTLTRVRALGIEPVGVSLDDPRWQEAFLRPRDADGVVIQVAAQSGPSPAPPAPADLPEPGASSSFAVVDYHVADLDRAIRLLGDALDGQVVSRDASAAELAWNNGAHVRLLRSGRSGIGDLGFERAEFSAVDASRAESLSQRLGVSVLLASKTRNPARAGTAAPRTTGRARG